MGIAAEWNKCRPGKACLECKYPDCIMMSGVSRVWPEETEMIKCAELPRKEYKKSARAVTRTDAERKRKNDNRNRKNKTHYPILIIPHN